MGVPGLWEILNKAGKSTSLAQLAIGEGFEKNQSGRRAYRLGIDISIWFRHTAWSKGGESAEVRNLFFRLIFLAKLPIIPLFIFDGRQRPKVKRGSRLGKSGSHELSKHFKKFLDAFGMEWREAPGEAEAELAALNRQGHIDAIMTDDCDAFIFGARTIMKNISANLSGNKNNLALNEDNKSDKLHAMVYSIADIQENPEIRLTRGGMILFALLSGGDYNKGLEGFGQVISHALARCGFGDELFDASQNLPRDDMLEFRAHWRVRVNEELKNNTHGFLKHRTKLLLPENFPDFDTLEKYAKPLCSQSTNSSIALRDNKELDIRQIARLCEEYFEWGYRTRIIERFRTLIWPCAVMHILRRATLEADNKEKNRRGPVTAATAVGAPAAIVQRYLVNKKTTANRAEEFADVFVRRDEPVAETTTTNNVPDPHPLIAEIVGNPRQHPSTDRVQEYRVEVSPVQLVQMANAGLKGTRATPAGVKEKDEDPNTSLRMWLPAVMLERVHPAMVEEFLMNKANKKNKGKKRAAGERNEVENIPTPSSSQRTEPRAPATAPRAQPSADDVWPSAQTEVPFDPWFASEHTPSPPRNRPKEGFLFTFRDPSFDDILEEPEADDHDGGLVTLADRHDDHEEQELELEAFVPKSKFDLLFEQMINGPSRNSQTNVKPKAKKKATKKRPLPQQELDERGAKRPRPSLLEILDTMDLT